MRRIGLRSMSAFALCTVLGGCAWMQANIAESNAEAARRYEADTASREAEAQRLATVCAGIESMGLYKNDTGTGVVEWLGKIRNNSGVAKIVQFAWIDQYGQQKTGQVQISGGQIASPRLDLTERRVIAPVKDFKLRTCQ